MAPDGFNLKRFETGLGGKFQIGNAATAILAASELSKMFQNISEGSIHEGLKKAKWPGRLEEFSFDGVRVILDGAHNPDGVKALAESFMLCGLAERTAVVFAAMKDKDLGAMIRILGSSFPMVVFTAVPGCERSALPYYLKGIAGNLDISSSLAVAKDPFDAIRMVEKDYGLVLCCGSLFLAGAIKSGMQEKGRLNPDGK
jgi:dihydrofolate synthase/folylpolyglutamate synthase